MFSRRSNKADGIIIIFLFDYIAYIFNCRFDLKRKKSNVELAYKNNGNIERFRLLFKEAFAEPNSGEVERKIKVKQ